MIRRAYRALKRQAGRLPYIFYLATPLIVAALPVEPLLAADPPPPAPKWLLVAHVFNHQTHHRGQVHCLLTQAGIRPSDTDLPFMRDEAT